MSDFQILAAMLKDLRPKFGAPGSRDVEVAKQQRAIDEVILFLSQHEQEAPTSWLPIKSAPRDGTNILLRFGLDGVSQGKFVPGTPHPWKFLDTNDGITWLINHAVDGPGGPSHWMRMPSAVIALQHAFPTGERQTSVPRVEPTSCGYCTFEESDGVLEEQCDACKATDAKLAKGSPS